MYAEPAYAEPAYTESVSTESEWAVSESFESSDQMDAQASAPEPVSYLESVLDARVGEPLASMTSPHEDQESPVDTGYAAPPAYVVEAEPKATTSFLREEPITREEPIEEVSVITPAPVSPKTVAASEPSQSSNSASFEAALAAIRAAWAKPAKGGASDRGPIAEVIDSDDEIALREATTRGIPRRITA